MTTLTSLSSRGHKLEMSPATFGELKRSDDQLGNPEALRQRMAADGYLYIPGFFDRDDVLEVRATLTNRLANEGLLDPNYPEIEAVANPVKSKGGFQPDLAKGNKVLETLIYGPHLLGFYEMFFGEAVLHFDYTWMRAVGPGLGTHPHCDLVYMGRGTHNLLTCWIPYGDIPLELGGLAILEDSHHKSDRIRKYLETDVDSYCENRKLHLEKLESPKHFFTAHTGVLSQNPVTLREKLGGRWITAEFQAGDILTFSMNLVHGSLDNMTDRIRLSSDSRYQRASEPADERWIGSNPSGHTRAAKRGRIC